jgi:predicted porin
MKKSLFAIAAVTAFAGAAQAQSSVTVYGILDVGYTGGTLQNTNANGIGNSATNVGRISNSLESGSRIGFRGTEDIGGGTSAQFVFELGMQPAGNAGSNPSGQNRGAGQAAVGTYQGQGSAVWNPDVRQAYVGLTQKGAGQVRIGVQNTLFWEQNANITGQLAQTAGSMLAPSTVGAFFDNGTTTQAGATIPQMSSYTTRTTNTVNLRSERMSGVMAKASYTQSNQSSNFAGTQAGVNDQSGYQVAVDWVIQKANIQASYAAFTSDNPVGSGAVAGWGGGLQGTNAKDNQLLVTASYDFGMLKAFAGYTDRTLTSTTVANNQLRRSAYEIGVRSFITPKIEGWASGGLGKLNAQDVGGNTANLTGWQLGSNYWLSKRTNLYAIVGQNNQASTTANAGIVGSVDTPKQNISQYSLGVRHTF